MQPSGEVVKKRLGRPPKKKPPEPVLPEPAAPEPKEPVHFVFKSKFRDDKVRLESGYKRQNPDGSWSIKNDKWAEFSHNTWTTDDQQEGLAMRAMIEAREDTDPLHIVETTNLD